MDRFLEVIRWEEKFYDKMLCDTYFEITFNYPGCTSSNMSQLGILVYGYDQEQAMDLHVNLEKLLSTDLFIFTATGKEDLIIRDILNSGPDLSFGDRETKILVFLGFQQDHIEMVLGDFPNTIQRPIFCGLTIHNIDWPVSQLIDHLLEEQRAWAEKKE